MGRRISVALASACLHCAASALELTPQNWAEHVQGRTVFLKFFAPWCGHCKKLRPEWSRLAADFNVDCTGGGKPLCERHNVTGYPQLLWGRAPELEVYAGGRDYASLKRFADGNLGSSCGPGDLGLCSQGRRALLEKFMRLSPEQLDGKIGVAERQLKRAEYAWITMEHNMSEKLKRAERRRDKKIQQIKRKHNLLDGSQSGQRELTLETWESATSGKVVFVKFFAPWCGHCKGHSPATPDENDWDRLTGDYEGTAGALVAEVDCAGSGKPLCEQHGVTGFPRLLWGSPPEELLMYTGARTYADLRRFADEHLGPTCGSGDLEACDETHRSSMEALAQLSPEKREAAVKQADQEIEKVVKAFESTHWDILLALDLAEQEKNNKTKTINDQGLAEAKQVQAWNKKQPPGFWKPPARTGNAPQSTLDELAANFDMAFQYFLDGQMPFFIVCLVAVGALIAAWRRQSSASDEEEEWCDLRHIILDSDADVSNARRRLDAGESFSDVAKECSTCPSRAVGGSLGRVAKGKMTQPELKRVCFDPASKLGEVLGPIRTQFGLHLVVIESRHSITLPTVAHRVEAKKEQ
ncbi:unnamed protein product [Prorocentrum cordatum]|uniref:Peptidylprolyl isomerase n=1 Tax=Prorocentrum cordatum TaxID=2364126 RepID=A0ABN9U0H9_9DINO|nr:unnamed protein product [Polarella glacialis]